jgi:hypothetical protein
MDETTRELILRTSHISRCAQASGRSSQCTCLPVARVALINHALAGLTLDAECRKQLMDEISKILGTNRDSSS